MNETLRDELLEMIGLDERVRAELVDSGELFDVGYEARMERVHDRNARRLHRIIVSVGWPGTDLVGSDGAEAAWLILQHAIAHPDLIRWALPLLQAAAREGRACPRPVALLEDRIRFFEGRPQRYGTQFDWDAEGNLSPCAMEDPQRVDERRRRVGLAPLAEQLEDARTLAAAAGDGPPADYEAYAKARDEWAATVGWRTAHPSR